MNFSSYNILSQLVLGWFLIIALLLIRFEDSIENLESLQNISNVFKGIIVPGTALAFLLGFFINTFASWLEGFLDFSWGGKPSDKLLLEEPQTGMWKVWLYESPKIRQLLEKDFGEETDNNRKLFGVAMRNALLVKNTRIADMNASYAFSRGVFVTFLLIFLLYIVNCLRYGTLNWALFGVLFLFLFISWLRAKQRGYYFAREVLTVYFQNKINSSN